MASCSRPDSSTLLSLSFDLPDEATGVDIVLATLESTSFASSAGEEQQGAVTISYQPGSVVLTIAPSPDDDDCELTDRAHWVNLDLDAPEGLRVDISAKACNASTLVAEGRVRDVTVPAEEWWHVCVQLAPATGDCL